MKKVFLFVLMLVSTTILYAENLSTVCDMPLNSCSIQPVCSSDYDLESVPWMVGKWKAKTEFGTEYTTFNADDTFKVSLTLSGRDSKLAFSMTINIGGTYGYSEDYSAVVCLYDLDSFSTKINNNKGFSQDEVDELIDTMREAYEESDVFLLYPTSHTKNRLSFLDDEGATMVYDRIVTNAK